jgi:hypothetical protein
VDKGLKGLKLAIEAAGSARRLAAKLGLSIGTGRKNLPLREVSAAS